MRSLVASVPLCLLVATACGSARPSSCGDESAATCHLERLIVDGQERSWVVSRRHGPDPVACTSDGPVPLILFFHGQDTNGSEARIDYAPFEDAIAGRALVVWPDGLSRPELGGNAGWDLAEDGSDVRFVDALLPRLAADECVDLSRVFAVGHSRGGRFIERLGCSRAGAFRAFAESSAGGPNVDRCEGRAPMWLAHATDDQQIAFAEGRATVERWASRNGCAAPPVDFPSSTCTPLAGCPAAAPVVFCPYAGTTWRGHYVPPFFGDEVWSFFAPRP